MSEDSSSNGSPQAQIPQPSNSMVPSFRLREETERRQKAEAGSKDAGAQLEAMRAELATAHAQLGNVKATHGQDMSLMAAGIQDAEVRDFIRERYQRMDGETRPVFGEWLDGQRENPSPLLAPFLQRQAAAAVKDEIEEAAPVKVESRRKAAPANPNAGTGQPARPSPGNWTRDDILRATAETGGRGLGSSRDAILKALAAEGLIRTKSV
jgi:3-oxoacyl-ACP reductase-like protein